MKYLSKVFLFFALVSFLNACSSDDDKNIMTQPTPIEVKVVVVNMFEIGEDEGDKAGEFQLWKKGQKLTKKFPFPQSHHDLFFNEKTGVLGMVTGMGTARSATAIMALGFDLILAKLIGWLLVLQALIQMMHQLVLLFGLLG